MLPLFAAPPRPPNYRAELVSGCIPAHQWIINIEPTKEVPIFHLLFFHTLHSSIIKSAGAKLEVAS